MNDVDIHLIQNGKRLTPMEKYELMKAAAGLHEPPPAIDTLEGDPPGYDAVDRPVHYTSGRIECIDAIDAAVADKPGEEAPYVANVIKYVWRYRRKGGAESLRKARWYLDRLISKLEPVPQARLESPGGKP